MLVVVVVLLIKLKYLDNCQLQLGQNNLGGKKSINRFRPEGTFQNENFEQFCAGLLENN